MIYQKIDGIRFKMREQFDFTFLKKYGTVFQVFDDQDSGNICFGMDSGDEKVFVKFAGAPTAEYQGNPEAAVNRLKETLPLYQTIHQKSLIQFLKSEEIGGGFAMVFRWHAGECMGRMYESSHRNIMQLPVAEKLGIFQDIIEFLQDLADQGYLAIDFYDGSILYDRTNKVTTICDIDFFRKSPSVNDMGQMWGSARFLSPEEYQLGATLDEITNVFTLGQMGFSLFTDSNMCIESWPLSFASYQVLNKAIAPDRTARYRSIREFATDWEKAIGEY